MGAPAGCTSSAAVRRERTGRANRPPVAIAPRHTRPPSRMGHGRPHQILLFPPPQERGVVLLLLLLLFAFFGLIFIYYGMLPEEMSSPSCFRLIVANCLSVTRSCFFFF